jgi:hypothetical protein
LSNGYKNVSKNDTDSLSGCGNLTGDQGYLFTKIVLHAHAPPAWVSGIVFRHAKVT